MSWVLYLFGSGQALFLGAAMVLVAVALLPGASGWRAAALAMLARLGLFVAVLSAVPLSYWVYAMALGLTGVWLWCERSKSRPASPALRCATGVLWLGIVLLELPFQFSPRLPATSNQPLYIVGDSVTAGMGSGAKRTWPELLPEFVEVHSLAQPGATTAMALKRQANQLPPVGGLVLLEIGGNDLLGGTSSAQFERDLDALLASVCGSPGRAVLMFELPLPPLANEFGRIQRRLAERYRVWLIPKRVLIGVLAGGGATLDSIHLSDEGHQRMATDVWKVLARAYK
jgi:acyl-CoA thioesterase I